MLFVPSEIKAQTFKQVSNDFASGVEIQILNLLGFYIDIILTLLP